MPNQKRSKSSKFKAKMNQKYKQFSSGRKYKSNASTNPDRQVKDNPQTNKHSFYRTKQTINLLNLYREKTDVEKMQIQPTKPQRIEPDRKWFGNIRTIDQKSLEKFRVEMAQRSNDPKQVLIKAKKLPLSLLQDKQKENKIQLLDIEKHEDVFGPKSRRKRVKTNCATLDDMVDNVETKQQSYKVDQDSNLNKTKTIQDKDINRDKRMEAGQSKRIWEELYKVLDASDVVLQILDSRDPNGTRCHHIEEHLKKNCPQKHLVQIINKCDLVPTWVTAKWIKYLSQSYPTIAFHASIHNPFGKGTLINLMRQFDNFHKDKKYISIGLIGYPNVGKSSVINALKSKKVCKSAPIPGETKVWQYVTMTKRIYLIDCPGVVYVNEGKKDIDVVLKGCVRAEKIDDPAHYISTILERAKKENLQKIYQIEDWEDEEDFLKKLAEKSGKLLKGGEPDRQTVAKSLLMDWQRGEIPYFQLPPLTDGVKGQEEIKEQEEYNLDKINEEEMKKQKIMEILPKSNNEQEKDDNDEKEKQEDKEDDQEKKIEEEKDDKMQEEEKQKN